MLFFKGASVRVRWERETTYIGYVTHAAPSRGYCWWLRLWRRPMPRIQTLQVYVPSIELTLGVANTEVDALVPMDDAIIRPYGELGELGELC